MNERREASSGPDEARAAETEPTLEARWRGLRSLYEGVTDPALLLDRSGRVLQASGPLAGLDPSELRGLLLVSLVAREQREQVDVALRNAISPGIAHTLDVPVLSPQGDHRWYAVHLSPVREAGAVGAVLVITTDITRRHDEEQRLRRSERLMVDTQGVAHLGTWEWDPREPHATWSPELYRIYGLDPATHRPSYQDYLLRVHPDDRERVQEATERVFNDHRAYSHDERVTRGDGQLRYLHTWAEAVLDDQGKLARLLGVCIDITDRKQAELRLAESEARFRAIFEGSGLGLATVGADGLFAQCNPALASLLGASAPELIGAPLASALAADDAPRLGAALGDLFAARSEVHRSEVRLARTDGAAAWARVTLSLVRSSDAGRAFALALFEDITPRKNAEEKATLAESRLERIRELENLSAWKSEVLHVASHELNNPLTPLMLQLQMVRDGRQGPLTEAQRASLGLVYEQTERLSKLLRDMQQVARIEQRSLSLRLSEVDVGRLCTRVVEVFRGAAADWSIALLARSEPDLLARADEDRLQQILFNLLTNAFKFTPRGGHVEVHAERDPGQIHVRVCDTGPGLNPEQIARLFQPFSQVHDPALPRGREPGSGLGLFISKQLAAAQDGQLWAESTPGEGATFHLTLPSA